MTKLDWSRGYTADPARTRSVEDFSTPDSGGGKGKRKSKRVWTAVLKSARAALPITEVSQLPRASHSMLRAMGISRRKLSSDRGPLLLSQLIREGVLLKNGRPNPSHPRVNAILAAQKAKSKSLHSPTQ